jgi:hypothetical protein
MSTDLWGEDLMFGGGYYESLEWLALRRQVWKRCGGVCEECQLLAMTIAHHRTYERFRHERLEDLQGVCERCHDYLHGRLISPTAEWLEHQDSIDLEIEQAVTIGDWNHQCPVHAGKPWVPYAQRFAAFGALIARVRARDIAAGKLSERQAQALATDTIERRRVIAECVAGHPAVRSQAPPDYRMIRQLGAIAALLSGKHTLAWGEDLTMMEFRARCVIDRALRHYLP